MQVTMRTRYAAITALAATTALAGCSSLPKFGGSKPPPAVTVDMNIYPANYRRQIVIMLSKLLTNRADYLNAMIAAPVLKPVADSSNPHYVVCMQYNNRTEHRNKMVIYLGGDPQQYIDATPQQCADASYQPFTELAAALPHK
jgi:hypothetical protein